MPPDCFYGEGPEAPFLGMSYKTVSQRSQISPKWKLVFPSLHSVRCHVHHLPPQTHLSSIDLTQKAFQWKMLGMKQYISIAQLKSKAKRCPVTLFYSVSILNLLQSKTISHSDQFEPLSYPDPRAPNLSPTIDKWPKLHIGGKKTKQNPNGLKTMLTERWDRFFWNCGIAIKFPVTCGQTPEVWHLTCVSRAAEPSAAACLSTLVFAPPEPAALCALRVWEHPVRQNTGAVRKWNKTGGGAIQMW